jgi:hypothetical protein
VIVASLEITVGMFFQLNILFLIDVKHSKV